MKAGRATEVILRAYPQADAKATEATAAELTSFLATLTDEELSWVLDTRSGIKTRCKFLPTPADIAELVRERHEFRRKLEPGNSGYRRFRPGDDDDVEVPDPERRRAQVMALLGYDPQAPKVPKKRELVPPSTDDIEGLKKLVKLKPPEVSDASPSLKKWLLEQRERND